MSLTEINGAVRSLEAIENYARAGLSIDTDFHGQNFRDPDVSIYEGEREFWLKVFNKEIRWNTAVLLTSMVLSEWVARVPGLYWTDSAKKTRNLAASAVEYESDNWTTLTPLGKSQKVMGGIGTLKFPPDRLGYRLASLTSGMNASAGVPILIAPEVWEYYRLSEGTVVWSVKARWQSMSALSWSERFQLTGKIPKGFLVLETPDQLHIDANTRNVPTRFHPYTVMEYRSDRATLYDFVYATADTGQANYRTHIERFFEEYRKDKNRSGRYLLAADIEDPLWDAEFESPEHLRRTEPGAKSQLELLNERVQARSFDGQKLEDILRLLTQRYQNDDLEMLSDDINIPDSNWSGGRTLADAAASFLNECVRCHQVAELVEAIQLTNEKTVRLRRVLAELYPTVEDSRRIVRDAQLPDERIDFTSKAALNWHRILREEENCNKTGRIIQIALRNYPNNPELRRFSLELNQFSGDF